MSNQYTWLVSPDKMIINGVSSDTVGIYVDTPPMPPMPEEIVEENTPLGRSESIVYHTGQYKNIEITVKCYVFDYGYLPDAIYKYLLGAKTLAFGADERYYYIVKKVGAITPSYQTKGKNLLSVKFICSPFKYISLNPEHTYVIPDGQTEWTVQVLNSGDVYCEPIIWLSTAEGHAVGHITVNGVAVSLPAVTNDDIYIDLQKMELYKVVDGQPISMQSYSSGRWWDFVFPPGYSEITWDGSRTMKITLNERWL